MERAQSSDGAEHAQEPLADAERRRAMRAFAMAELSELDPVMERLSGLPTWHYVRQPEHGLVMLRGRMGGGGAPFNFGEATVSRAAVALASGETGFGQCLGRSKRKAALSALFDALYQHPDWQQTIETEVVQPVLERQAADDAHTRNAAVSTRVDFFTMVRGDD